MDFKQITHIVTANVAALRVGPDSKCEQDTGCTLGQEVAAEEVSGEWTRVFVLRDNVCGWVRSSALAAVDSCIYPYPGDGDAVYISSLAADVFTKHSTASRIKTKLTIGTRIPVVEKQGEWVKTLLPCRSECWAQGRDTQANPICSPNDGPDEVADKLLTLAERFIGVPYLWGGTTPFGIDCSGFVQLLFRLCGVYIPRNSRQQYAFEGCRRVPADNIKRADLLFFGDSECNINHVGLSLGGSDFIHSSASQGVCISSIADSYYKSVFVSAGRVL